MLLRPWRDDDSVDAFRTDALRRYFGRAAGGIPQRDPDAPDYAIVERATDEVVGRVWCRWGARPPEIGYFLREDAWGRGLATRSVKLVTGRLLGPGGNERVLLYTHPENVASQRVAERCGFAPDGIDESYAHFRDGSTRALRFVLTRA